MAPDQPVSSAAGASGVPGVQLLTVTRGETVSSKSLSVPSVLYLVGKILQEMLLGPSKVNLETTTGELNVNTDSLFNINICVPPSSRHKNMFTVDVVNIAHTGDLTRYHLQNISHNFSEWYTAAELSLAIDSDTLTPC